MVFEMSRRLSRYKRGRRAVDLSASRFDGERQKTASPPARQPSLLFTAVPSDFFLFFSPLPPLYFPHRPSSSRPISSVQSLLLIRSTLSFLMQGTFSPSLTLSTTERVLVASSLRNTDIRENRDICYYYY